MGTNKSTYLDKSIAIVGATVPILVVGGVVVVSRIVDPPNQSARGIPTRRILL